jgi:hypothetical protein
MLKLLFIRYTVLTNLHLGQKFTGYAERMNLYITGILNMKFKNIETGECLYETGRTSNRKDSFK